ncbi:MAG: fibronectin type III domain-containing protein [Acidimicrobiaceae bacterium]|nr:fibronectin type III domain-containing protein [Acidimicrobiaceae bacterium]
MSTPYAPDWITPAQPGLITNGAGGTATGTAQGAFTPPLTLRYASPAGQQDGPVSVHYRLTQTTLKGAPINPTVVYDSGWGQPAVRPTGATSPLPTTTRLTSRGALWSEAVGRVYLFDYQRNLVWSAPVSGTSVGSWRAENPPPSGWLLWGDPTLVCGQIFAMTRNGIVQVPLNADGTLGTWIYSGVAGGPAQAAQGAPTVNTIQSAAGLVGLDYGQGLGGVIVILQAGANSYSYPIDPGTQTVSGQIAGPALPIQWFNGAAVFDTSWWPGSANAGTQVYLHVIPGRTGVATGGDTFWTTMTVPYDPAPGTLGASWNAGAPLPNWVNSFGFAATPQMLSGGRLNGPDYGKDQDMYLFSGQATANTVPVTSILAISGVRFRNSTAGGWGSVTPVSGWTPAIGCGACSWPMSGANTGLPAFCIGQFGGTTDAQGSSGVLAVQTFFPGQLASAPANSVPPFYSPGTNNPMPVTSGPGQVLPDARLQGDGSYLYTFTPSLPSQSTWGGPYDGDSYTLQVDFACQTTGDPSPSALTTIDFAKPPSVTNVKPSGRYPDGSPTVSFTYQAGAFGGPLESWRAIITLGDVTYADSGLQYGDTTWTPMPAPCLAPGHNYGLSITVNSTDDPMTSSDSASATYFGTFSPEYVAPDSPFNFVCTQDFSRGAVAATWQNPANVVFNRIYYRLHYSEDPTWWLLQEGIHADPSGTNSITLIDQLALRQYYDFAVTGLDAAQTRESGVSIAIANGDMEDEGPADVTPGAQSAFSESFEQNPYSTVLWRSLGTDCLNTADGWTMVSPGVTMESNSLRIGDGLNTQWRANRGGNGSPGWAQAGHPDWGDGTFSVRLTIPLGGAPCWPKVMVHVAPGGASWVSFEWVPSSNYNVPGNSGRLRIFVASPQLTTTPVPDGASDIPQTPGGSFWMVFTVQDHNYTGHLYTDSNGSIGTLLGSISASVWPTAVGAGQIALTCLNGEVVYGGPYANVCTWSGPAPSNWTPDMPSGVLPSTTQRTLDESFADTSGWTATSSYGWAGSVTDTANTVTIPPGFLLLSNANTFRDGIFTLRFQQGTDPFSGWVVIRATSIAPNTSVINGVIVGWNGYYNNPGRLYINPSTAANGWQNGGVSSSAITWTPGAWYWMKITAQGANVTAQIFSDNAGAIGSLIVQTSAFIPDAGLQVGSVGVFNACQLGNSNFVIGGNYASICTWDAYDLGLITPAGTPAATESAFTDTFANLNAWYQASTAANATLASNVVSLVPGSCLLSNAVYDDGIWTVRVRNGANASLCPWMTVRGSNPGSAWNGAWWVPNSISIQWSRGNTNGVYGIAMHKSINGALTPLAESIQVFTVTANAWYWVRVVMQGPNITFQMFNDNNGAMGTLIGECTGYAADAVLSRGSIGFGAQPGTGMNTFQMGGAFADVCTFETFTPASGPGEPAFAHSGWFAQDGQMSASIYQPTGQNLTLSYPSWARQFEQVLVPVQQNCVYQFSAQINSSAPPNAGLVVQEYSSSGALVASTTLTDQGGGLAWRGAYPVTAAGSSANYTTTTYGTLVRQAPSFAATSTGSIQEGQPSMVLAQAVPDQQQAGYNWWPIAWQGGTSYLWVADAPGPATVTRGGLQPTTVSMSVRLIPNPLTAFISVRCAAFGPGLHYWDMLAITAIPNTSIAYFTSVGTDATGTLDAWTPTQGAENPYLAAVTNDQPAAWWRLDDIGPLAADSTAGRRSALLSATGVTQGVLSPIQGDAPVDRATAFDGTGSIALPTDVPVGQVAGQPWTLQCWFMVDPSAPMADAPQIFNNSSGGELVQLGFNSAGQLTVLCQSGNPLTITTPNFRDGNWHHVVVTNSGDPNNTLTISVDGAQLGNLVGGGGRLFYPGSDRNPLLGGPGIPGAPTGVTATGMDAAALVSWTAPTLNGGSPITGYRIQRSSYQSSPAGGALSTWGFAASVNGLAVTISVWGMAYQQVLTATFGSSGTITLPAADQSGFCSYTYNFAAAGQAVVNVYGGSSGTYHTATVQVGGTAPVASDIVTAAATPTSFSVSGTGSGIPTQFRVQAVNAVGSGPWSAWTTVVTPTTPSAIYTVPGPPTINQNVTVGVQQLAVYWTPPANNGGTPITGYYLEWAQTNSNTWYGISGAWNVGNVTGIWVGPLSESIGYAFRVSAVNAVGRGPVSIGGYGPSLDSAFTITTYPAAPPPAIQTITVGASTAMATGIWGSMVNPLQVYFSIPRAGQIHVYGNITARPEYWANNTYPTGTRYLWTNTSWGNSGKYLLGGTSPTWSTYETVNRDDWFNCSYGGNFLAQWVVEAGGGNQIRVTGGSLYVVFVG